MFCFKWEDRFGCWVFWSEPDGCGRLWAPSARALPVWLCGGGGLMGSLQSDEWKVLSPPLSRPLASLLSLPSQGSALLVMV